MLIKDSMNHFLMMPLLMRALNCSSEIGWLILTSSNVRTETYLLGSKSAGLCAYTRPLDL